MGWPDWRYERVMFKLPHDYSKLSDRFKRLAKHWCHLYADQVLAKRVNDAEYARITSNTTLYAAYYTYDIEQVRFPPIQDFWKLQDEVQTHSLPKRTKQFKIKCV